MLSRRCPCCNADIGLWTILKPGCTAEAGPVECPACGRVISRPWRNYLWLPIAGVGIGLGLDQVMRSVFPGLGFLQYLGLTLAFIAIALLAIARAFPLRCKSD